MLSLFFTFTMKEKNLGTYCVAACCAACRETDVETLGENSLNLF